jgi:FkbM family methyltransferase
MNGMSWVRHWNAAVSEVSGEQELILSQGEGATTSHLAYEGEHNTPFATIRVAKVRLDDLVSRGELRLPRLVKVDVEGHAAPALRGAREAIATARPTVFISFHSPQEVAGTRAVLEPLGYTSAWLDGRRCTWDDVACGSELIFTAS